MNAELAEPAKKSQVGSACSAGPAFIRETRERLTTVRRLRRLLQLLVRLVEQPLRLLGVAAEIPLVGLLRIGDLPKRLVDEPLGVGQVRMTFGVHVARGLRK